MDIKTPKTQGNITQKVIVETAEKHAQTGSRDHEEDMVETLEENQEKEKLQLAQIDKNIEIIQWLVGTGHSEKALETSREIRKLCLNQSDNPEYNDIKDVAEVIITKLEKRTTLNPEAPEFVPAKLQVNRANINITGEGSNAHDDQDGH